MYIFQRYHITYSRPHTINTTHTKETSVRFFSITTPNIMCYPQLVHIRKICFKFYIWKTILAVSFMHIFISCCDLAYLNEIWAMINPMHSYVKQNRLFIFTKFWCVRLDVSSSRDGQLFWTLVSVNYDIDIFVYMYCAQWIVVAKSNNSHAPIRHIWLKMSRKKV